MRRRSCSAWPAGRYTRKTAAVVNGICAVPMMVAIMIIANRPKTMGNHGIGRGLKVLGWIATFVMLVAAVVMFATMGKGS